MLDGHAPLRHALKSMSPKQQAAEARIGSSEDPASGPYVAPTAAIRMATSPAARAP